MKHFILMIFICFGYVSAQAWVDGPTAEKEHRFVYRMKAQENGRPVMQTFEYASSAPSYDEAFEQAAKACYRHFKNGKRLTEDKGLDIIDVCANPRSL